ncbi:hypothetical protein KXS11_08735 [Plantibacter flavus]|uniref:hypothetical protein n=1 Tax=Plantibacter flavus TaxID=150123 RepID=UPI003F18F97F
MSDTATPKPTRLRAVIAALTMLVPALAIGLSYLAWAPVLPAEVASHWSGAGAPDDSLPTMPVLITTLVVALVSAVATIVLLAVPRPQMRTKRMIVLLIGLVAGMAAAVWIIPTWLTVQAGSVDGAVLGLWIVPLAVSSLWGVIPAAILPAQPLHLPGAVPVSMELGETEVGAWSRTITATMFAWMTAVVVALTAAIYIPIVLQGEVEVAVFGLVVMVAAALVCASFIRLRVSVDWRGLRVVSLFGIPLKRIPLDRVDVVEATDIRPMDWGGWGYRVMPGRSAVVLRAGAGLVVTTTADKQFAITIDEPERPAGLLQALAARV